MSIYLLFENGRLSYPEEHPRPEVEVIVLPDAAPLRLSQVTSFERKLLRRKHYRIGADVDLYAFEGEGPSDWLRQYARTWMTGRVHVYLDVLVTVGEDVAQVERLAIQLLHHLLYTEVRRERVLSSRERRRRARWAGRRHTSRVPKRVVESVRCMDLPAIEMHLRGIRSAKVAAFVAQLAG